LIEAPAELIIIVLVLLAWRLAGKKVAVFTYLGLFFIYNLGQWTVTMETIALVISAVHALYADRHTLGILGAKNQTAHRIIMPILDFMQTLPAFRVPVAGYSFFWIGSSTGVITTIIFAMPPVIRLTDLGLKQVPEELIELGKSFGSTFWQMLLKIELPLARLLCWQVSTNV
jgi:glycine betaine/proline transport system permease protein